MGTEASYLFGILNALISISLLLWNSWKEFMRHYFNDEGKIIVMFVGWKHAT